MSKAYERYQKRRLISSYFSVTLSISLVLFLLGVFGLILVNANKVTKLFKEQMTILVFLKDNAKQIEVDQLQKHLALADYTKNAQYVAKEDAAEQFNEDIGENFIEFLGYNPLLNSINVHLKASYVNNDSLKTIVADLEKKAYVQEVNYDKPMIGLINDNIQKIGFWLLIVSGVITVIVVLLIHSSIRLSIYSKRFTIKTMQLVGATKSFIRKPFIRKNMQLGFTGSLLAILALGGLVYFIHRSYPELKLHEEWLPLGILFASVLLIGLFISAISTYFATQRFLNLQTDDLYF
ncbi:MAG: permease-like cell division protein FtsX [Flavobacteriaceae bacterium]|nr:permease-like cell division protein FtsX [Flavobacteriaceae bacterium]